MRLRAALPCCVALLWAVAPVGVHGEPIIPEDTATIRPLNFSTTNASEQAGYTASSSFDAQGMEHLYTLTNYFVSLVLSKGFPEVLVSKQFVERPVSYSLEHKWELFAEYKALAILTFVGLALAILVPLVGLIACCCRCCDNCGGRTDVPEKPSDSCTRGVFGLLMFLIIISMLFAIVCAFVTNEYVVAGTRSLPSHLAASIHDFGLYMNNTQNQVEQLLVKDFEQLARRIDEELDRTGNRMRFQFAKATKAFAANDLLNVVERLDNITALLQRIETAAQELGRGSGELTSKLTTEEQTIRGIITRCNAQPCQSISSSPEFRQLPMALYSQLPTSEVQQLRSTLQKLTNDKIAEEIRKGIDNFNSVNTTFQNEVKGVVQDVHDKVKSIGQQLKDAKKDYQYSVNSTSANTVVELINRWVEYADPYLPYYRYTGMGVCCIVTAIFLFYTMGVTWGACGSRNGSCSLGTGATLLAWGVAIFCSTYLIIQLPVTAMFVAGSLAERSGCDIAQSPESNSTQRLLHFAAGEFSYNVSLIAFVARTIPKCRSADWSLHRVIQEAEREKVLSENHMLRVVDFDAVQNFRADQKLDEKINELADRLGSTTFQVDLLSPEAERLVEELQQAPFSSVDVAQFQEKIKDDPPANQLKDFAEKLRDAANILPPASSQVATDLKNSAGRIDAYVNANVPDITANLRILRSSLTELKSQMVVNGSKIEDAVRQQYDSVRQARDTIRQKGKAMVKDLGVKMVDGLVGLVNQYVNHSKVQAQNEIGRCKPVSDAYDSAVNSICMGVVLPFNGFWVSVGWCLIFGIPAAMFALVLMSLYRRVDSFNGPMSDSDYISDTAYTERDTIPLAQVNRKPRRGRGVYDNRNGYLHDYSPEYRDHPQRSLTGVASPTVAYVPAPHYNYSRDPDLPPYKPTHGPTAPPVGEWVQGGTDYHKPPPYYFPGP